MDSQWLKTQFDLNPAKSRADLARALELDPPAISKMLAGGRQIKAHEYVAMRRFFDLPVDGARAVAGGYQLQTLASGLSERESVDDQDAWIMPARLLESKTDAPPEKIRIFTVRDNSMEPDFAVGTQVLVDLSDTMPSPPGVFVMSDGVGPVLRQCDIVPGEAPLQVNVSSRSGVSFRLSVDKASTIGRVIARLEWLK
jgi:hypothetical protein